MCKDLAQRCLATTCFTHKKHWLFILKTFEDKTCESLELVGHNNGWQVELFGQISEHTTQSCVEEVSVELFDVQLCFENLFDSLLNVLLVAVIS